MEEEPSDMAWMPSASSQIHNTFASLGRKQGDTYSVNADCLSILEEILRKLAVEDQTLRTFRRAIGFGQNISKDLIPLLIYVKDDTKICDATKIIDATIKILVNLTIPVECLLSIETVSRSDIGRHTIFELNRLLYTSKEAFVDSRSTKAVVDHIKHVTDRDTILNVQQCDSINNCLSLLRNIMHIPEDRSSISDCPLARKSMQNEIIWNLFTQSIDKIIIHLLSYHQKMYWGVTLVQLIALMFKDQQVGTLQKLLNLWLETSLSESTEDNESNTSPPDQESGDSSPVITSDPTSDSSDNGGSGKCNDNIPSNGSLRNMDAATRVNRSKALTSGLMRVSTETENSATSSGISSINSMSEPATPDQHHQDGIEEEMAPQKTMQQQSEVSDCGYVTQVENEESISTSSNDDEQPRQKPVHQKPHTFQKTRYNNHQKIRTVLSLERKELRRKKLVKRSKTNLINMKGLMYHQPTDEDISNILKEFTVDFLLKGYGNLVHDLHLQFLSNIQAPIDTSHFFWLITYFLKFATQLELDLEHVSSVLSYEIISYIIFQGVWIYEELEICCDIPECDLKPCLRRLHLVITAIREFLQAVESYLKLPHLNNKDRQMLLRLEEQIAQTEDLRRLFLLLLRQYNPKLQSRQYLQDLIVTNHTYLLFMDHLSKVEERSSNIVEHLKEFASVEVMRQYGLLLQYFNENGEFVNNCVFTMMHHIGGDLKNVSTLFQPNILKTFSRIWETDYEICDDWSDLIEYVIHKFINTPRANPCVKNNLSATNFDDISILKEHKKQWNNWEAIKMEAESEQNGVVGEETIEGKFNENEDTKVDKQMEMIEDFKRFSFDAGPSINDADLMALKDNIHKENNGSQVLVWLQTITIEACFVKLTMEHEDLKMKFIVEPSVYYYARLHLPIPVVPWTFDQSDTIKKLPFIRLLHKLGFYLPVDTGKIFIRIPDFWTADYLFKIALQLGPIDTRKLKFDVSLLQGQMNKSNEYPSDNLQLDYCCNHEQGNKRKLSTCSLGPIPSILRCTQPLNSTEWVQSRAMQTESCLFSGISSSHSTRMQHPSTTFDKIDQSANDITLIEEDNADYIEQHSISETASVTSDLTRMCVSDEEEKSPLQNGKSL